MMGEFTTVIPLPIALLCAALLTWAIANRHLNVYPPGPRGLPFVGAAFSLPKEKEWVTYDEWKEKYGPIVGIRAFGNKLVILNTADLSNRLLNKRSRIYSQRGPTPMLEMMGFDWNIGLMPVGQRLTLARQVLLRGLSAQNVIGYRAYQEKYVRMLLGNLIESPANFARHLRRFNVSMTLELFFGLETKERLHDHDEFVTLNETIMDLTSRAGSPSAYIVNTFPSFKYWPASFPGGGFHGESKRARELVDKLMEMTLEFQKKLVKNQVPGVYLPTQLAGDIQEKETATAVSDAAATTYAGETINILADNKQNVMYPAGIETTTSTLLSFVLAMVLYPDIQRNAQATIDQAIHNRTPTLADRDEGRLPIIDAIIKECLRWAPPGAFGLPHLAREDDSVDGYTIPKGTIVLSNVWSILHEEKTYSQPMEFRPQRFMGKNKEPDPADHAFGYGKRICPGRHLAESSLWLVIASILATFEISPAVDDSGRPIIPKMDFTSGVMRHPVTFPCIIKPRSRAAEPGAKAK
ncbi:cytochrome P450 [Collybia nuda]|uniref:Cytochrome P450 n=1 Tax=Collybia nuda TaxID=64659 RepID=A0A9P5XYK5_9AGAR|nr:cytochrome P450 [Collybia nuda]